MRYGSRALALILVLVLVLVLATRSGAGGGEATPDSVKAGGELAPAHGPIRAPFHGGVLSTVDENEFETVLAPGGMQVYLYTKDGAPAMVEGATGEAVITFTGGKSVEAPLVMEVPARVEPAVYFCPMHPAVVQAKPGICEKCGGMVLYKQNRLSCRVDFAQARPGPVAADVTLQGISGRRGEAHFSVSVAAAKPKSPAASGTGPAARRPATSGGTVKLDARKDAGAK